MRRLQMEKRDIYNKDFYIDRDKKTRYSASKILDIVREYIKVDSAIDVGCGVGTWLKELKSHGATRILGIDGERVDKSLLVIDDTEFITRDLSKELDINERFDLAINLEVAEHLPIEVADSFVENLCSLADAVLFSAATKYQGGDGHINEQRLSYWQDLFDKKGYKLVDMIRKNIWNDIDIPVWYRQNVVLFVKDEVYDEKFKQICDDGGIVDIIHPQLYEEKLFSYRNELYICKEKLNQIERRSLIYKCKHFVVRVIGYIKRYVNK